MSILINLVEGTEGTFLQDSFTLETNGEVYFRYDTDDSTAKENFTLYCEIQEELRAIGFELYEQTIEHDCISGYIRNIQTPFSGS